MIGKSALIFAAAAFGSVVAAEPAAIPGADRIAAQRQAMALFSWMDGVWRGPATSSGPAGPIALVQTERSGTMLDGTLRIVEGRGYRADGVLAFNAFAVISYEPSARRYEIASWASGYAGRFPIQPTPDGFVWETPAGPGATMRYTARRTADGWVETGERIVAGQPPQTVFTMDLKRVGATDWPSAGAPGPK